MRAVVVALLIGAALTAPHAQDRERARSAAAPRAAEEHRSYPALEALEREIERMAVEARPSVVSVVARTRAEVLLRGLGDQVRLETRRHIERQVAQALPRRVGSGVVIDDRGHVATMVSVVGGASDVEVLTADGSRLAAAVKGLDPDSGVAVLSVKDGATLRPVRLGDASALKPGSLVTTLGNLHEPTPSFTVGFVSGKGVSEGPLRRGPWIRLDAHTTPGSAGGPVFDSKGRMVGLLFGAGGRARRHGDLIRWEEPPEPAAPLEPPEPLEPPDPAEPVHRLPEVTAGDPEAMALLLSLHRQGGSGDGVSYAVPVDVVRWVSERLIAKGEVRRGWMGVTIESSTDEPGVVRIQMVEDGGPARSSGLREGDRIESVMGEPVETADDVVEHLARLEPGDTLRLVVSRGGSPRNVSVVLQDRPKPPPRAQQKWSWEWKDPYPAPPRLGVLLEDETDDALRQRLGAPRGTGLLVTEVIDGSRAAAAGMQPGDLLVSISGDAIRSLEDVRGALRDKKEDLEVKVIRHGNVLVLQLPPPSPRAPRAAPHPPRPSRPPGSH